MFPPLFPTAMIDKVDVRVEVMMDRPAVEVALSRGPSGSDPSSLAAESSLIYKTGLSGNEQKPTLTPRRAVPESTGYEIHYSSKAARYLVISL